MLKKDGILPWDTMKLLMKQKEAHISGFVRIYLRAGEAGSIVNIDVSKQWSNVSYQKIIPLVPIILRIL